MTGSSKEIVKQTVTITEVFRGAQQGEAAPGTGRGAGLTAGRRNEQGSRAHTPAGAAEALWVLLLALVLFGSGSAGSSPGWTTHKHRCDVLRFSQCRRE